MILTPLQKLPKNGGDWGKLSVAKGFKKLPKIQNIAQSGHTDRHRLHYHYGRYNFSHNIFFAEILKSIISKGGSLKMHIENCQTISNERHVQCDQMARFFVQYLAI